MIVCIYVLTQLIIKERHDQRKGGASMFTIKTGNTKRWIAARKIKLKI